MKNLETSKGLADSVLICIVFVSAIVSPLALTVPSPHPISNAIICGINCNPCVIRVCIPNFHVTTSLNSLSVPFGQSATVVIHATPIGSWSGNVSLTASVSPSVANGLTTSLSLGTICVPNFPVVCTSGTTTSTLTVTALPNTPNGNYVATVTGTSSDTLAPSSVAISVNVPSPIAIIPSSTSLTSLSGERENSTVNVHSLYGFSGAVTLTSSITPSMSAVLFSPATITVPAGGDATSTLTFGPTLLGNYSIAIMGSSGPFTGQGTLTARTTDFTINASSVPSNVQAGSSYNTTITLISLNGFAGEVGLSASPQEGGPRSLSFNPLLTLAAGGKASTTLSVFTAPANTGRYTLNITATTRARSATLSHSVIVNFTATPNSVAPLTILGLQPLHFYGALGGAATALVFAAAIAISRRRKSSNFAPPPGTSMQEKPPSGKQEIGENAPNLSAASTQQKPTQPTGLPRKGIAKIFPTSIPGVQIPKPIVQHRVPIILVSGGTALVVAALATISPQAGVFGGLFIPGIVLLGVGSVILFLQLFQRPVAVRRYCMHCGSQMSAVAAECSSCHKQPMSGIDTRACPNCNAVNPAPAKFCKDCGAGQSNSSILSALTP